MTQVWIICCIYLVWVKGSQEKRLWTAYRGLRLVCMSLGGRSAVPMAGSATARLHAAHRCRSANWIKSLLSGCRGSTSPHLCPLGWHFLLEHLLDINFLFYLFIPSLLWPVTGYIPHSHPCLSPSWHAKQKQGYHYFLCYICYLYFTRLLNLEDLP